ncbi:MAG TPA: hypothetical protein VF937_10075, partial [Chloroflexota bacterium]
MPAELLRNAARIFRDEALDGYRDRKVIGGLAGFIENLRRVSPSPEVDRLAALLGEYASLPPSERAERLTRAQRLLSPQTAADEVPTRPVASVPAAPPPPPLRVPTTGSVKAATPPA